MDLLAIAGTDTDVGKTVLTVSLAAYWQKYRWCSTLGLMKLLQTGTGDRQLYERLFSSESNLEIVAPLCLETPVAPPIAAAKENTTIDLGMVWQELTSLQTRRDFIIVETLGGLGSPVTDELTVADIAASWRLPLVLVVPVKLGAISNAVANVALARSLSVDLKGIVLNCVQPNSEEKIADLAPIDLIQSLTKVPILGVLPHLSEATDIGKLARVASNLDLEMIFSFSNKTVLNHL